MSFSSQRCCGDCSLCASTSQHALRCLHLHSFWCPLAWQPFLHLVARLARALLGVPRGPRRWLTPWATARQGSVSLYRWLHSRESLVESPASRSSNGLAPPKSIMGSPAQRDCVQGSRFTSTLAASCQDFFDSAGACAFQGMLCHVPLHADAPFNPGSHGGSQSQAALAPSLGIACQMFYIAVCRCLACPGIILIQSRETDPCSW